MLYFKLYANCFLVRGVNRTLLCDLQKGNAEFLPNELEEIISILSKKTTINELFAKYSHSEKSTINEYIDYLISNEYGFLCTSDEFDAFPPLSTSFYLPKIISNAIIEITNDLKLLKFK